jgi:hypothetical protein
MKHPNKSWFSIVIWMWVVVVATLAAYFILSFALPFAKNIKWIENSSSAYYNSYWWIEDSMYFVNKERVTITAEKTSTSSTSTWYTFTTSSSWNTIPLPWQWSSDFDSDYNAISSLDPIQLQVWWLWNGIFNTIKFYFKVPDLESTPTVSLSWWTYNVINWTLISPTDTLITTSDYIKSNEIGNSKDFSTPYYIWPKNWETLYWSWMTFTNFYNANCSTDCILKMSVISDLKLNDISKTQIPSISYKIDFWTSVKAPLRYTTIKSIWKSYGFRKDLEIKVPQQTVPQAFDFTVFQ